MRLRTYVFVCVNDAFLCYAVGALLRELGRNDGGTTSLGHHLGSSLCGYCTLNVVTLIIVARSKQVWQYRVGFCLQAQAGR